jgi:hypothetical protein
MLGCHCLKGKPMPDSRQRQRQEREHDAWFRAEVEQGLREADDPTVRRIPNVVVRQRWRERRASLLKRIPSNGRRD